MSRVEVGSPPALRFTTSSLALLLLSPMQVDDHRSIATVRLPCQPTPFTCTILMAPSSEQPGVGAEAVQWVAAGVMPRARAELRGQRGLLQGWQQRREPIIGWRPLLQ